MKIIWREREDWQLEIGRLTGVSAGEEVTSAAQSSRKSSGRRGEGVVRSQGAGRTLLTETPWRDERQVVSHRVRPPYDNFHQRIVTSQPDARSARAYPPSAANTNVNDRTAVQQLGRQTYKPAGATASRQVRNNGGSSMAAGSPALRQFQQALGGSRPAGDSAGSTMDAGKKRQRSSPEPDADDKRARRGRTETGGS